jgi:hypothetical protein
MVHPDMQVMGTSGSEWVRGQKEWGSAIPFTPTAPGMSTNGGTGEIGRLWSAPTLVGEGPPIQYEVRISPTWGEAVCPAGPGLLKAQISSGVGAARHRLTCDVGYRGASVIVVGGSIQVDVFQTDRISQALQSVGISIGRATSGLVGATDSYVPVGTIFGAFRVDGGFMPSHATAVRIGCYRPSGNHVLRFVDENAFIVAEYNSAADPDLTGIAGVPIPAGARQWSLSWPVVAARSPVVTWLLDC